MTPDFYSVLKRTSILEHQVKKNFFSQLPDEINKT